MSRFVVPAATILAADLAELAAACLAQDLDRVDAGFNAVQERALHLDKTEIETGKDLLLNQDRDDSLLKILDAIKSLPNPFDIVRASIIDLVAKVYETYSSSAFSAYADPLIGICLILFRSDRSYRVRVSALQLIILLIKDDELADSTRQSLTAIIATLIDEARAWAKLKSDSVRKLVLEAFGVISARYSDKVTADQVKFLNMIFTKHLTSPSNLVVEGVLRGLSGFLSSFSEHFTSLDTVFKVICAILSTEHTRYGVPLAALDLLSEQATLFRPLFVTCVTTIISLLQSCVYHRNRDISHHGSQAFDSVIYEISVAVGDSSEGEEMGSLYSFVIRKLITMMPRFSSDTSGITAAVRGIGLFAGAIYSYKQDGELRKYIGEILEWWQRVYIASDNQDLDLRTANFSSFVSSIAMMVQYVNDPDSSSIVSLQAMLVRLFASFPSMYAKRRDENCLALLRLTVVSSQSVTLINRIFSSTVFQALVLSLNAVRKPTGRQEYEDYVDLWMKWLVSDMENWQRGLRSEVWPLLEPARKYIYSMVIGSLLKILSRLDISISEGGGDSAIPSNPNDFTVFLNLVDFCLSFLPLVQPRWFGPYSVEFFNHVVPLLNTSPNISGSLKLLGCIVTICREHGYAQPYALRDVASIALARIGNLENELLFVYLEFILNVPENIVSRLSLLPAIKRSLEIGLLHEKFAELAVHTLSSWTTDPNRVRSDLMPILDYLLSYIRSNATSSTLQTRIFLLIGQLGLTPETISQSWHQASVSHAWDTLLHLHFDLPFSRSASLPITFDRFLSAACDIAVRSSDRQLKISAAEYLHAIIIKCVCDDARDPRKRRVSPLQKIYSNLFPIALRLSVDVDVSVATPFRTLTLQLCHWYSQSDNDQGLLSALMNAACDSSNAALRDIGSKSIAECFKWQLKFSRLDTVRTLLRRVCALCRRQERGKRLGAYGILSRIYRDFRERNDLVAEFTLRIVHDLLASMTLMELELNETRSLLARISERTLGYFLRIIADPNHGKAHLLQDRDLSRSGMSTCYSLSDLLRWIASQIVRNHCKHQAVFIKAFDSILPGHGSAPDLIDLEQFRAVISRSLKDDLDFVCTLQLVRWGISHSLPVVNNEFKQRLLQFLGSCEDPAPIEPASLQSLFEVVDAIDLNGDIVVDFAIRVLFCKHHDGHDLTTAVRRALGGIRIDAGRIRRCCRFDLEKVSAADLLDRIHLVHALLVLCSNGTLVLHIATVAERLAAQLSNLSIEPTQYEQACAILGLTLEIGLSEQKLFQLIRASEPFRVSCSTAVSVHLFRHRSLSLISDLVRSLFSNFDSHSDLRSIMFDGFEQVLLKLRPYEPDDRQRIIAALDSFCKFLPDQLSSNVEDVRAQTRFLHRICVWDPSLVADRHQPRLQLIVKFCDQCLASEHDPVVDDVLDVVRHIFTVGSSSDAIDQTLSDSIRRLTTSAPWPQKSIDIEAGTPVNLRCAALLTKILDILVFCRRPELLESLLGIVRERHHRQQAAIDSCMQSLVSVLSSSSLGRSDGLYWAHWAIRLFSNPNIDRSRHDNARAFIADTFLVPFVMRSVRGVVGVFVSQHARSIWQLTDSGDVVSSRGAFDIIRALLERFQDERQLVLAALQTDLKSACKKCADHLKTAMTPDDPELDRLYHTAAYSCLCALLLSRPSPDAQSTPEKLIVGLCLNETRSDPTWSQLVDRFWAPSFTIDMTFPISAVTMAAAADSEPPPPVRRRATRVRLSSTSLSQDLLMLREEAYLGAVIAADEPAPGPAQQMELDPLNALGAMPALINLIRELSRRFGADPQTSTPLWVHQIRDMMRSSSVVVQVRLLVLKLVLNCPAEFAPYAEFLFADIVAVITSDSIGGVGFHYLLADLASMFLHDWTFVPSDTESASRFTQHLMSVADDIGDQTQPESKIQYHLTLIRGLVQKWASCALRFNAGIGLQILNTTSNRSIYVGLSLIEVPLLIGRPEHEPSSEIGFDQLSIALLRCLSHESRIVSNRAASLFGRLFEYERVSSRSDSEREQRRLRVRSIVIALANQGQSGRFVTIVMRIGRHCPAFVDEGIAGQVVPLAVRGRGDLQLNAIQALMPTATTAQNPLNVVVPVLNQAMGQKLPEIDRAILLLVLLVVPRLSLVQIKDVIWPALTRHATDSDLLVRLTLCKIMIAIATKFADLTDDLIRSVRAQLLAAFHDEHRDIRSLSGDFWSSSAAAHSTSPSSLLIWLLNALPIGCDFIGLATFLWLSVSEQHAAMSEPLSPFPLSDSVNFVPLNVDGTWRPYSDPTQTPLYSSVASTPEPAFIPATPDPEFSLSQTISSLDPSNPAIDALMPSYEPEARPTAATTLPGRLPKRFGARPIIQARAAAIRRMDRDKRDAARNLGEQRERRERSVQLYRTYRDGELPDVQILFVLLSSAEPIYRPQRDLIAPLRMLYRDRSVTDLVFLTVFAALMDKVSDRDGELIRLHLAQIVSNPGPVASPALASVVLLACRQCQRIDIPAASIIRMAQLNSCLESGVLLLEHQIAPLSRERNGTVRTSKKRGADSDVEKQHWDRESLCSLYELYESLYDADMIAALSLRLAHEPETSQAVANMFAGTFHDAFRQFESLLTKDDTADVDDFEIELWEEGRIQALAYLGQWQPVLDSVLSSIDDPVSDESWRRLWSDDVDLFTGHPHLRLKYINYYQKSIRKLDGQRDRIAEFATVAESHLDRHPGIAFDLCMNIAELGDDLRARTFLDRSLNLVLHELQRVSVSGIQKTHRLVRQLHILTEFHESFHITEPDQCRIWIRRRPESLHLSESVFVDDLTRSRLSSLARLERLHPDWKPQLQSIAFRVGLETAQIYLDQGNTYQASLFLNVSNSLHPRHTDLRFYEFALALQQNQDPDQVLSRFPLESLPDLQRLDAYLLLFVKGQPDVLVEQCSSDAQRLLGRLADSATSDQTEHIARCLMRCARYCQMQLTTSESDVSLTHHLVSNVLIAMAHSTESTEMFPYILDRVINSDSARLLATFTDLARAVPSWMLLRWVAQIIAYLSSSLQIILPILERIAQDYPHALIYPLVVSLKDRAQPNKQAVQALEQLLHQCNLPQTRRLISELNRLIFPEHQFRSWAALCSTLLAQGRVDEARESYLEFRRDCLPQDVTTKTMAAFRNEFQNEIDSTFGPDGRKLESLQPDAIEKECSRIVRQRISQLPHGVMSLSDFSPFLSAFEYSETEYIEAPGQYGGWNRPNPASHSRIVSFDPVVHCIRSVRRPKKVVIHGSDEREYSWLVKGGEGRWDLLIESTAVNDDLDLRLDERIQSMFTVMNAVFNGDASCSQRRLSIATYAVIPMTPNLGIIEWVQNTVGLTSCVELQVGEQFLSDLHASFRESLMKAVRIRSQTSLLAAYNTMVSRSNSHSSLTSAYRSTCSQLPAGLFALIARSFCNSEASLMDIRSRMTQSYAVAAIAAYILGIGDRHLDNLLIDQATGNLLQIDFGVAFDQGLQLPIPELVPIRYTPMFQNALFPLPPSTLVYQTMVHTMRALRSNRQTLLTVMEVFIREPHVDWQKKSKASDETGRNAMMMFDGKRKMEFAGMKLQGFSSVWIMSEELLLTANPNKEKLSEIVQGNRRAKYGDLVLSIEDQVQCLLDHSSDELILALTYEGWRPYV